MIWIDQPGTHALIEQACTDTLEYLKKSLTNSLDKRVNDNTSEYASFYKSAALQIQTDIDRTRYITQIGRYAMYSGPYPILVDMYTQDIFFYFEGIGYRSIYKVDLTDPELFLAGYLFE